MAITDDLAPARAADGSLRSTGGHDLDITISDLRNGRVLVLLLFAVAAACAQAPQRAEYSVPGSDVTVALERKPTHRVVAEYERSASLLVGGQRVAQRALFSDTGGYSRTNLYQLGEARLLLRDADASYVVDPASKTIAKDESRRKGGTFLGSFDIDSSKQWRFVPAAERPEMPTEFKGG